MGGNNALSWLQCSPQVVVTAFGTKAIDATAAIGCPIAKTVIFSLGHGLPILLLKIESANTTNSQKISSLRIARHLTFRNLLIRKFGAKPHSQTELDACQRPCRLEKCRLINM